MKIIIIANIFGLIALILNLIGSVATKKKKVLIYNGTSNLVVCVQYIILATIKPDAWTGAISSMLATSRNVAFSFFKEKIPLYIFLIYVAAVLLLNLPACTSWLSVIPMFNIIFFGYALFQNNVGRLKIISIIVNLAGMFYDIYNMAFISAGSGAFATIFSVIGYIRYRKESLH